MSKPLIDMNGNPREQLSELLKRHSVDCLTCPKAGACEIQDLCARWQPKIKTLPVESENVDLGILIERHPERCIRCGRCAEFIRAVGEESDTLPPSKPVLSLLSGTLIDICPAAALVDKTQKSWSGLGKRRRFKARTRPTARCRPLKSKRRKAKSCGFHPLRRCRFPTKPAFRSTDCASTALTVRICARTAF